MASASDQPDILFVTDANSARLRSEERLELLAKEGEERERKGKERKRELCKYNKARVTSRGVYVT